jgi:hypothetical protein
MKSVIESKFLETYLINQNFSKGYYWWGEQIIVIFKQYFLVIIINQFIVFFGVWRLGSLVFCYNKVIYIFIIILTKI